MGNIYQSFGLTEIINGYGKMTVLGGSTASDAVALAVKDALQNFVSIDELMDFAGEEIAAHTGAEAGCPALGAASATAIAAASVIAGENLHNIIRIPNTDGMKNEIILQKGHVVNFGAEITQSLRLGGAIPIEVGASNKVLPAQIEGAITEKTAALFYVKSHHAVQKGMVSIKEMLEIAHRHNLPFIVDAAAEEDLRKYVALGADIVYYSGGKALSGPTSGLVAGKKEAIRAFRAQYEGIGRMMKCSKESITGMITALREYSQKDDSAALAGRNTMQWVCDQLDGFHGITAMLEQDEAGREIYRAVINFSHSGKSAEEVHTFLKSGNPAIYLRGYYENLGLLHVDPRPLKLGQEKTIVSKIKSCFE